MQLIKLDATDSTNTYLRKLQLSGELEDFTVVQAIHQYEGRGQRGSNWLTEPGKNLTISILKKHSSLPVRDGFSITMAVSLGIYSVLKQALVPELSVKWPNDILSGNAKICGILIENMLAGSQIQSSIVGIGLNVNQTDFGALAHASSLRLILGRTLPLEEMLQELLKSLHSTLNRMKTQPSGALQESYEKLLFRKGKPSTFRDREGQLFMGFIKGVTHAGKLVVALEDDVRREFDHKEIELLY